VTSEADCGALYEQVRQELIGIVRAASDMQLALPVPAAPEWRVRDVLAHVVGLAAALNAQDFPAADDEGGTAWGARVLAARHGRSVEELIGEWDREAPTFEEGLRLFGYEFGSHFFADLLVHVHDVQATLGLPPTDDPACLTAALDHYCGYLHGLLADAGWGTVVVQADHARSLGSGPVRAHVAAPAYDVLRTVCARRSERQIRALAWEGDLDGFVEFLRTGWSGGYTLPATDQP